jgi:hypothetical protein
LASSLGVFLMHAAKDPATNPSRFWFTLWSDIVRGGILLVPALVDVTERANPLGDIRLL